MTRSATETHTGKTAVKCDVSERSWRIGNKPERKTVNVAHKRNTNSNVHVLGTSYNSQEQVFQVRLLDNHQHLSYMCVCDG